MNLEELSEEKLLELYENHDCEDGECEVCLEWRGRLTDNYEPEYQSDELGDPDR